MRTAFSQGPPEDEAAREHDEAIRLASAGQVAEAIPHFERARQLQPWNEVRHFNAGLAYQQLDRLSEAIQAYHQALQLAPQFFDVWSNLSAALKSADQLDAAIEAGRTAVALRPGSAPAHLNLGNALKARGEWREAEQAYRRAVALDPKEPRYKLNLANSLREEGRLAEAIPMLRETVREHPNFPEAHRDLAFALLLSGELAPGWVENEWRWQTLDMQAKRRSFVQPTWSGEPLNGKSLLVYTEQGFGDAIQFVRFVHHAFERGAQVILECQPALFRLFKSLRRLSALVARGAELPPFDYQIALLSLPRVLGTKLESIPARVPYLNQWEIRSDLADALKTGARLKIGVAWAGNPGHRNDRNRSLPIEALKPLAQINGVTLFNLQVGDRCQEWPVLAQAGGPHQHIDLSSMLSDYADTAAVMERLDVVVTVDTSVAHLAGALGRPVWLLLPFAPDWRWLLHREDSPWYPTMWLVRQPAPRDWATPVHRIGQRIEEFLADPVISGPS